MPWPIFPQCPAYGFTSLPDYSDTPVELASGARSINRNWYYPLHVYTAVPIGDKPQDDIHRVLHFWHAMGGRARKFLFNDYLDFKSSPVFSQPITAIDQPLVETSTPGVYQLTKVYADPDLLFQQQRKIQKPKSGTVIVASGGVTLTPTTDYTIDYDSGLVTIVGGVDSPPVLTWGGEFWVPVQFETKPEFTASNYRIQQTQFALRESRLKLVDSVLV